jgi:hypothetical protein
MLRRFDALPARAAAALGLLAGFVGALVVGFVVIPGLGPGSGVAPSASPGTSPASASPTSAGRPSAAPTVGLADFAIWVAPDGRDEAPGTAEAPMRNPQAALDRGAAKLHLAPGSYGGFELHRSGVEILGPEAGGARFTGKIELRGVRDVRLRDLEVTGVDDPYTPALLVDDSRGVRLEELAATGNTFGIQLRDVEDVSITNGRFSHNGAGIEIHGGARNVVIRDNEFERNDRAVDNSRGANGINLYKATGPVRIVANRFRSNFNPRPRAGTDAGGGAIEVYATSDVTITENVITDSSVMETGTEDDIPCQRLTFTRNVAYRGPDAPDQHGLVLRCASDSIVAHNTFHGLDDFAFDLIHEAGAFGGSIEGLRVVNNVVTGGRAFSIDNAMPPSVQIDHNLVWNPGSPVSMGEFVAYVAGRGNTRSTDQMRAWGLDRRGVSGDPRYVDLAGGDLRIAPGSPAIDAALRLPGINDDAPDGRPDIGRFEVAMATGSAGGA